MKFYRLSPLAEADIEQIWRYTFENWSSAQADRYIDDLFDAFELLADNPSMAQRGHGVTAGYRRYRVGHHLIFYKPAAGKGVEIIRILHEKSDMLRHLRFD
ncbi:type II toxin-antitoxin system RelE/ParE family toxin [Rhizobium sp. RU36D]|uniref:type II toxin-antitoxin system RelE/ParE family toxin n=1 Tax=Rhizobium sp. RU36D TaxID=1907415 RepID=UPI0009D7FC9A|nr:type II toxin-antitoxin system RelE/ParE family toxin [Rhizobium sp. RU36D]SMC92195.1 toxin ParE1/3/4 [Rhizobium sp. RU36D]